jgi:hypothetical protein
MVEHGSPEVELDDAMSISSYETGHENFDDDNDDNGVRTPRADSEVPFMLPSSAQSTNLETAPSHDVPQQNGNGNGKAAPNEGTTETHEVSSVTLSDTTTGGAPVRRKSVRLSSFPPQVLERTPTPGEFDEDGLFPDPSVSPQRQAKWKTRAVASTAVWEDSSDEDEGYKAARHALSRAERRSNVIKR